MPHLRYRDPSGASAVFELKDKEIVVGRLPDCDLVISSGVVSRRHARVVPRNGGWVIIDLNSAHGTFVNRLRVDQKELAPDDEIRIGEEVIVFSDKAVVPRLRVSRSAMARPSEAVTASQEARPSEAEIPTGDSALPPVVNRKKVDEVALVKAAMDATRLDLAKLRSPAGEKKGRATSEGELLALVRIADGIHRCPDIASVCRTAVEMAMRATGADRGTISVRDEKKRDFVAMAELHATKNAFVTAPVLVSRTFVREVMREKVALFARDTGADRKLSMAQSVVALEIRSILGAPLWDGDRILGYLYLDSTGAGRRFAPRDLDLVSVIGYQAGAAISRMKLAERIREEEQRRSNYARFFSADVIRHIDEEGKQGRLDPALSMQEQVVTVLFSDIQGFTAIGEGVGPGELKRFLDAYFDVMTEILVDRCHGSLDKYIGDGIMALFGAPYSQGGAENDAQRAVDAAVRMRDAFDQLRRDFPDRGGVQIRIGINTGKVIAGWLGSKRRIEYTVIGDAVNVASRLETTCEPGKIQIGEPTWELVKDRFLCEAAGERHVKNRAQPVKAWWVSRAK